MTFTSSAPADASTHRTATHNLEAPRHLSGAYRTTLNLLFKDPMSHHLAWNDVRELFDQVGEARQLSNHRYQLTIDHHSLAFLKPHTPHLTGAEMLELRQFLMAAGWTPHILSVADAETVATAQAKRVAVVVVSRHDAEVYHFSATPSEIGPADTSKRFEIVDGGRSRFLDEIADATADDERIIVMGRLDKDLESIEGLARRLREHHPHAIGRSVHEMATDDHHLDAEAIRDLARAAGS